MNLILSAEMELKLLEVLAAADGASERLTEVWLPKFLSYLSKIRLAWGCRRRGVLKMFCESQ